MTVKLNASAWMIVSDINKSN